MIEALTDGTPLAYIAGAYYSHAPWRGDDSDGARRGIERKLRKAEAAARQAKQLPARRLPTSPAVGKALRRFQTYSAEHREAFGASRSPAAWESAATLLDLQADLVRLMAHASGEHRDVLGIERNARRHRAEAERLRQLA